MKRRCCGRCGLPGHDRRSHRKRRNPLGAVGSGVATGIGVGLGLTAVEHAKRRLRKRPTRQSLDAYTTNGVVHPIRGSDGYDDRQRVQRSHAKYGLKGQPRRRYPARRRRSKR